MERKKINKSNYLRKHVDVLHIWASHILIYRPSIQHLSLFSTAAWLSAKPRRVGASAERKGSAVKEGETRLNEGARASCPEKEERLNWHLELCGIFCPHWGRRLARNNNSRHVPTKGRRAPLSEWSVFAGPFLDARALNARALTALCVWETWLAARGCKEPGCSTVFTPFF